MKSSLLLEPRIYTNIQVQFNLSFRQAIDLFTCMLRRHGNNLMRRTCISEMVGKNNYFCPYNILKLSWVLYKALLAVSYMRSCYVYASGKKKGCQNF